MKTPPFSLSLLLLLPLTAFGLVATPAQADGPGSGTPYVVTLGDSYISGEAGRWAGSSNDSSSRADALGSTAYYDNAGGTGETIDRCHRSKSAEAFIGGGVNGLNLACSGAKATTYTDGNGRFKPGLDFYNSGGQQGQALMLQNFAATHNVKMVAVSIGGNDFNFADIVQTCVTDFLTSPTWAKDFCNDDSSVSSNFTSGNVSAVKTKSVRSMSPRGWRASRPASNPAATESNCCRGRGSCAPSAAPRHCEWDRCPDRQG